jgi:aminopeptidase N
MPSQDPENWKPGDPPVYDYHGLSPAKPTFAEIKQAANNDEQSSPEPKAELAEKATALVAELKRNAAQRDTLQQHKRLVRTALARTDEAETALARLMALPNDQIAARQRALAELERRAARMQAAQAAMVDAGVPGT